ncbi:hybrid sensor histidine kinase/response regulator [Cerasicoccus frondis]|uniref:hybrid sensor histidine kinase/response regulator n=1 Tax=Cerasicoccus frondis TaxID=490090 RepID=UPI002852D432|nr:hybrid sensor histidine kinase/response regulator [Cerasicoccus frondis]
MKLIEPEKPTAKPLILAVDDQPENLRLLGNSLAKENVSLAFALNGEQALEWLKENRPDLILLDVSMPGMDGLACCRQIKTQNEFLDTPIIFLTARVEAEDIQAGFLAGAVDYVTKPFKSAELIARINTHLKLQAQRKELETHIRQKSDLIGIIAHDVRGPISSIRSLVEIVMSEYPRSPEEKDADVYNELMLAIIGGADRTLYTLNELLNAKFSHSGEIEPQIEEFPLPNIFEDVRLRNAGQAMRKHITLEFDSGDCPMAKADPFLMAEVLDNLVSNAVKYSPQGKTVKVAATLGADGQPTLLVSDEGPGFREEDYDKLFGRYQRLSAHPTGGESSFGLGLSIVKDLMLAQGGDIQLVSEPNESARFQITFK